MKIRALLLTTLLLAAPIGVYSTAYAHAPDKGDEAESCGHHHMGKLWSQLPEEKRQILHATMEEVHKQNAALHKEAHKLHAKLEALFVAPKFDKDAYLDARTKLDALHAKMKANMEVAFASVATQFSSDERKILEKLHQLRHHHGGWDHDKSHGEWSHHSEESSHKSQEN